MALNMLFVSSAGSCMLFFVATVLLCLVAIVHHIIKDPLRSLPGPWTSRWTSLVSKFNFLNGEKPRYVQSLHDKYGPVVRISPDEVAINDISAVRQIHRVGGRYLKSGFYTHIGHRSAKTLFSSTDPKHHAVRRRLLSAPMSEQSLALYEPVVVDRVGLCISQMSAELKARELMDIFKWWTFFATDVIGELSFGRSFQMLEHGQKSQYTTDLENVSSLMAVRTTFPFLTKVSGYVPIPIFKHAAESGARMGSYAQQSIERYKSIMVHESEPKPTLFANVLNGGADSLTDAEARLEAGGYIVAGSDTAAITLTYLVWAVCKDKDIRNQLVAEVGSLPNSFNDQDVRKLSYLNHVVDETLRLYPAVPGALPRAVPPEGAVLAGHRLPGGTTVSTQAYSLHRDPNTFPNPYRFDPSRWAAPTPEMKAAFMPFGGGTRICIGMHLARMEMRLAVAHFFRMFPTAKVSEREGMCDEDMAQKIYFLVSPRGHRCLIDSE